MDGAPLRLAAQPLHLQLRRALVQRIASGEWRHGDVIPNENELAREFNLSPGTVRKALDWMEQARLVIRQQGRGTFITDPTSPEFAGRFDTLHGPDGSKLSTVPATTAVEAGIATADEAHTLQLNREQPSARVLRVRQTRRGPSGRVIMVEQAVLPEHLFRGMPSMEEGGYDVVQASKHCNVLLGEGTERVSMAAPPDAVAALFGLRDNALVLVLDRVIFTVEDVPAEMRKAWCVLGDNSYQARLA
jgi:GntR family transcriptional regulator